MSPRHIHTRELETELTPFPKALELVLAAIEPLAPTRVDVTRADGLDLAVDVKAQEDIPRRDNSSMDGYVVTAATLSSGDLIHDPVKIMTGHALPQGADSVVPWEDTTADNDGVRLTGEVRPGQFVRRAGEDITHGQTVMTSGETLTPAHLGLLSAMGITQVEVQPQPRVSIVCTGDEIVAPGMERKSNQLFDANTSALSALMVRTGAEIDQQLYAPDDKEVVRKAILAGLENSHAIVTTGGASVGEHDWTREVIEEEGEVLMWRVDLRPGKPFALGRVQGKPVFVLPGNPASVLACAHAFVLPALRKLMKRSPQPRTVAAPLTEDIEVVGSRQFLCPVRYQNGAAVAMPRASSSVLSNQLHANGFVLMTPGIHRAGNNVNVELSD